MTDIIKLLPETVANQIAAGEVIQRPASAVKELLENAVDAESTNIELYIKESGKTMIRIVDNGLGMTPSDARLSFARHATSKIKSAEELFSIRTKGFRGEALASIAAISQVELKSMKAGEEIGTQIEIEGNEFLDQRPVGMTAGTSISVKNLFYNVPARRNFLKSNPIEARHIIDEFERVALAHPEVAFSLNMNNIEHFRLPISNLRQRIVNIYGSNYNERLVPIAEETTLLTITGFVGKPEYSRKTRGEQFFFVNKRYIKDGYLHHAVSNAFEELLPKDSYASYWLYIDIDPAKIDVNIHPTKTEIKFEDERSVYAIVRSAVKRSLGQYNVAPALDFERERTFDVPHAMRYQPVQMPTVLVNPGYNPFQKESRPIASAGWDKVYDDIRKVQLPVQDQPSSSTPIDFEEFIINSKNFFQLGPYIVAKTGDNLLLIDATSAHERIIYNQLINKINGQAISSQQMLFPQTIQLNSSDLQIIKEIEKEIRDFGFDISEFGLNTYVLNAAPVGIPSGREKGILEDIIEQYKNNSSELSSGIAEKLAHSMSKSMAVRRGDQLSEEEIQSLIQELMKSDKKDRGIDGKPCMKVLKTTDLSDYFK
ncbi:MAG TPA: DNA mismatch repair endonuclease MutL [Bacteroidia bacterium]|nr:DNA mismatch repair endonuclease MutL [Bacteroidota bacterium]HQV99006.1 DNA mismatch repair endonuclease MutL [Bacteroidia bacterium]